MLRARLLVVAALALSVSFAHPLAAPQSQGNRPAATEPPQLRPPTRADLLRGDYGRYRANNDLLHCALDLRVDPEKKLLSGKNTIRFRMLQDDTRLHLDLYPNLTIERIALDGRDLKYERIGRFSGRIGRSSSPW